MDPDETLEVTAVSVGDKDFAVLDIQLTQEI